MPNVPNITPGPDDTEHTPEGATETIPLITDVHADKESGRTNDTAERHMPSSRQNVPNVDAKS